MIVICSSKSPPSTNSNIHYVWISSYICALHYLLHCPHDVRRNGYRNFLRVPSIRGHPMLIMVESNRRVLCTALSCDHVISSLLPTRRYTAPRKLCVLSAPFAASAVFLRRCAISLYAVFGYPFNNAP